MDDVGNIFERLNDERSDNKSQARTKTLLKLQACLLYRYTVEKFILFSCLDLLIFSVYLNKNNKKTTFLNINFVDRGN